MRFQLFSAIIPVVVSALAGSSNAQTVLYVDAAAPPGGDGLSWATAFQHPQSALDTDLGGPVEVWVAQGAYYPTFRIEQEDDRTATFVMRNQHALYGGFAGNETERSQRDPTAHPTIFSGDIGTPNDPTDNAYHVVWSSHNDRSCILDGVTVRDGDGGAVVDQGGGLYAQSSYIQIRNCLFVHNTAQLEGAAIYVYGGKMTLTDVVVRDNVAVNEGGAVSLVNAGALLVRCRFEDNQGASRGGALRMLNGSYEVIDCTFSNNHAGTGAGIFGDRTRQMIVTGSTFDHNVAESGGGAIQISGLNGAIIERCTIVDNSAVLGDAGGIAISTNEPSWVRNSFIARNTSGRSGGGVFGNLHGGGVYGCVITDNHAVNGGGVYMSPREPSTVVASTIYGNSAEDSGGGLYNVGSAVDCKPIGCIFWNNSDSTGQGETAQITMRFDLPILNSNCVQGWTGSWYGFGNFGDDPMFVDPDAGNFALRPGSPCIDAGNNTAIPENGEIDFMHEPRQVDDPNAPDNGFGTPPLIDMGAIEFQADARPLVLNVVGHCPSGGVQLVSWAGARPGSQVVVLYASTEGQFYIPSGYPCAGTSLNLSTDHLTQMISAASDPDGKRTVPLVVPRRACGGWLQAIEIRRCWTSNAVQLN